MIGRTRRGATALGSRLRALCNPSIVGSSEIAATSTLLSSTTSSSSSFSPPLAASSSYFSLSSFSTITSSSSSNRNSYGNNPYAFLSTRNFSISSAHSRQNNDADDNNSSSSSAFPQTTQPTDSLDIDATTSSLASPDSIVDLAAVAVRAALDAAAEGCWAPTRALQWLIETVHDTTGLPWWGSIMLTTCGIRLATFPIMLMQIKNTYRLSQARPEVETLVEHLKQEQARGNPNAVSEYQSRVTQVWAKYKANPLKSMVTLFIQAPLFIGFFSALRGMAAAKVPSLMEGGTLWFTDLTVPDASYALPILASATFLLTVEVGAADGMEGQTDKMKSRMKNIMRVVALIIVPFSGNMPASVFMYWTASNAFSLGQTLFLKIPGMKQTLGLPNLSPKGGGLNVEPGKPLTTFTHKPVVGTAAVTRHVEEAEIISREEPMAGAPTASSTPPPAAPPAPAASQTTTATKGAAKTGGPQPPKQSKAKKGSGIKKKRK